MQKKRMDSEPFKKGIKVLVLGASGSGTTTLGKELERKTYLRHLDVDDYYWKKTEPPFREKVPLSTRNKNLKSDFHRLANVVVSGSLVSWGKEWESAFDLVVFIRLANKERMGRLKKREEERYGDKLLTDTGIQENSRAFLHWANQYENPHFKGRSLNAHINWLKSFECPVLEVDGKLELSKKVELVLREMNGVGRTV
ncbi:MAG: AAA family ATPase [Bacteroidota bacterium]